MKINERYVAMMLKKKHCELISSGNFPCLRIFFFPLPANFYATLKRGGGRGESEFEFYVPRAQLQQNNGLISRFILRSNHASFHCNKNNAIRNCSILPVSNLRSLTCNVEHLMNEYP